MQKPTPKDKESAGVTKASESPDCGRGNKAWEWGVDLDVLDCCGRRAEREVSRYVPPYHCTCCALRSVCATGHSLIHVISQSSLDDSIESRILVLLSTAHLGDKLHEVRSFPPPAPPV